MFFHSRERIQTYRDLLPNSPDACARRSYPERKCWGFKSIRINVDEALVVKPFHKNLKYDWLKGGVSAQFENGTVSKIWCNFTIAMAGDFSTDSEIRDRA